ncbi:UNVERIFIED_CONTAM: Formin-like protein 5 [Sesamum calycinum]|uniref:Formin-like protein n=1 Tax=Sesamum calycinum TaxID=2727403 RepID=A0AAW2MA20_9LAMI
MDIRFVAFFVAFISVFAANGSEGNRKLAESFLDNGGSLDVQEIDKNKACKRQRRPFYLQHVLRLNKYGRIADKLKDLELRNWPIRSHNEVKFDPTSSVKRIIQKTIADLPPKKKETALACLREKNFPSSVLRDEQETWSAKYQKLLSGWASIPRRLLRSKVAKQVVRAAAAPVPAPLESPVKPPSPSPVKVPPPSPDEAPPSPPVKAPPPTARGRARAPPPPAVDSPPELPDVDSPPELPDVDISSAVGALAVFALIVILCGKKPKKIEAKDGQRDVKPLLNLSTSNVSAGNELPPELVQTLLKMAPTTDEELKLRLYTGDLALLGPAERFLKVLVEIPFAFKRLEALLFVSTFQEDFSSLKEALATLEHLTSRRPYWPADIKPSQMFRVVPYPFVAFTGVSVRQDHPSCDVLVELTLYDPFQVASTELKNSRLFLKLLEAVLKTGNRMNDGTYRGGAMAFKLDTLLKLSDVKGTDGKTTLLHFVIHEIIKSEGLRAARRLKESRSMSSAKTEDFAEDASHELEEYHRSLGLQVVSGLSSELANVRKAAIFDNENLSEAVVKLNQSLVKIKQFFETDLKSIEGESEFHGNLSGFIHQSESDMIWLAEEEKRIMALVKKTGDYFHGKAGKDEGLHVFAIVRDFLLMLDKVCKDVKSSSALPSKTPRKETVASSPSPPSQESQPESSLDMHRQLFPSMREQQMDDDFSSDDES